MKRLASNKELWTDEEAEHAEVGYCGVIYLSWSSSDPEEELGSENAIRALWKLFADRRARRLAPAFAMAAEREWKNGDLFIKLLLPKGSRDETEGRLFEYARAVSDSWEAQFLQQTPPDLDVSRSGKLLVGAAAAACRNGHADGDCRYEACKQALLNGQAAGSLERSIHRRELERILAAGDTIPVYQPIVSLSDRKVFGYEALTRLSSQRVFAGPLQLFAFAEAESRLYALDRLAREKAIVGCARLGEGQKLFINVMAQIMDDPEFSPGRTLSLLEKHELSPRQVVFELTERAAIADYEVVKKALAHYRSQGYQIAIDDVGAGYSSLQSIVELRPDYMKVDRSIVQDIHRDEMKAHIMSTLLGIGNKMGVSLIAEGIEQEEELELLLQLGVHYAQGYLLGRPAPFEI